MVTLGESRAETSHVATVSVLLLKHRELDFCPCCELVTKESSCGQLLPVFCWRIPEGRFNLATQGYTAWAILCWIRPGRNFSMESSFLQMSSDTARTSRRKSWSKSWLNWWIIRTRKAPYLLMLCSKPFSRVTADVQVSRIWRVVGHQHLESHNFPRLDLQTDLTCCWRCPHPESRTCSTQYMSWLHRLGHLTFI